MNAARIVCLVRQQECKETERVRLADNMGRSRARMGKTASPSNLESLYRLSLFMEDSYGE